MINLGMRVASTWKKIFFCKRYFIRQSVASILMAFTGSIFTTAVASDSTPSSGSELIPSKSLSSPHEPLLGEAAADVDLCAHFPTGTKRVPVKRVAKPPFGKFYKDPAFGSKVIRITNSRRDDVHKPLYSTIQAWNADESLLMLYRRQNKETDYVILDGQSYEEVAVINVQPSSAEDVFWSHSDPDVFYYMNKYSLGGTGLGEFREYNVRTNQQRVLKDFRPWCGRQIMPKPGGDVQMHSIDDDLFGFRCNTRENESFALSYRVSTDEVKKMPIGKSVSPWNKWYAPMPLPNGNGFWMQGHSLRLDFSKKHKPDMRKFNEHSSLGRTHEGANALFQVAFDASPKGCNRDRKKGIGHLVEHNLDTGKCRNIVSQEDGYPYPTSGTHLSALAVERPGWVAMSSMGYDQFKWFKNEKAAPPLFSEIYLVNTDPDNETVCRVAQHRSMGKRAEDTGYKSYFGEAHASISPSGTRVIFGSDWYGSGSVDAYVVELPAFKRR